MEINFYYLYAAFGTFLHLVRYFVLRLRIPFERPVSRRDTYINACFTSFVCVWFVPEFLYMHKGTEYGVVTEDFYVQYFIFLVPDREREMIMRLYVPFRSLFVVSALCSRFSPTGCNINFRCLVSTSVFTTLTFCYRLMIIKLLIKRETVRFTPFILCLFMFLTAVYWFFYSILERDPFAAIPNAFASFLGAWQLILYAKYRRNVQHII